MAMEVCLASPRISFSHDLSQSDLSPSSPADTRRLDASLPLDPTASDFDFSLSCEISLDDPSPADELFSDGKILPLSIKNPLPTSSPLPSLPTPPSLLLDKKGSLRDAIVSSDDETSSKKTSAHKPFWRFGRSSSVGDSRQKTGLLCPFPLSRSKSTGSYPNSNLNPSRNSNSNTRHRNENIIDSAQDAAGNLGANPVMFRKSSSDAGTKTRYYYSGSNRGSYGNGVRISPVLNVPAPFISRGGSGNGSGGGNSSSAGVFAYLLCSCGDKSMKRSAVSCSE